MDNTRKQFLMTLTDYEKKLFTEYAKKKGWSIGKFLRISAKSMILMQKDRLNLDSALHEAARQDSNTKLEL